MKSYTHLFSQGLPEIFGNLRQAVSHPSASKLQTHTDRALAQTRWPNQLMPSWCPPACATHLSHCPLLFTLSKITHFTNLAHLKSVFTWPIIMYKNLNKCFIFFSENHFWSFLLICLSLQENRLIIPNNIENWYRKIVKEVIIDTFYLKLQLLPATSQDSGEFTFQQDCRSAQNTLFYDINISQGSVATHLRWGGIFNNCFIANFLENVTVKELWKSASIWRSYA